MARIAGVDLPRTKRVEIGLTYIFGIGRVRSNGILKDAGVSPDVRVKDLSEDDVRKISRVIEEQGGVEGDLRKEVSMNIKRLMEIGCYRGARHRRGAGGAQRRQRGEGRRHAFARRAHQRTGLRPRIGRPRAPDGGPRSEIDSRRDADSPQRLPSAEAEESVNGALYRTCLPTLPP